MSRVLPCISIGVIVVAVCLQQIAVKNISLRQNLSKESFKEVPYTVGDIPTTLYSAGRIGDVLKEWNHEGFHLYRLKAGESFDVDYMHINSSVRAKSLRSECKWESVLCTPCFNESNMVTTVDTTTVFSEPGWYASFAKISDDAVEKLWNLLKLPFNVEIAELEHAFISNLKSPMITAAIHANPMTSSMAIQFVGRKTWLFYPADTYVSSMGAVPAAPILLPKRSPREPYTLYVYTSQPGDVLFFPESWAHAVLTYDGPNVMVNYRNFHYKNILRQPFTWITAMFNLKMFPELIHRGGVAAGGAAQNEAVPEKKLNKDIYGKLDELCTDGVTDFDNQMLELLRSEQKKYQ